MRTRVELISLCGLLLALTGCAGNSIIAHKTTRSAQWYGDVGITGHQNVVTIERNSLVFELSIMGDGNEIIVEDDASLAKIEVWGSNNTISLPANMHPKYRNVGDNNRVLNRASPWRSGGDAGASWQPTDSGGAATPPPPADMDRTPDAESQPADDSHSVYP